MKTNSLSSIFFLFLTFLIIPQLAFSDWPMLGANPERTSAVSDEIRGNVGAVWYRPIEPYINYKIQVITADNKVFMSTARGVYCLDANNGDIIWVYPTEIPLGHSPTYYNGKLYVGSYDRTIHCIDVTGANAGNKTSGWNPYVALAGFETNPLVVDAGQGVRVYAGSRDGYFYCLDATNGNLIWRYKTDGAIRLSAAIDSDNVIYFAADDLIGYALKDNGATYQEVWKSAKMLGESFSSYWPVVYTEKSTGRKFVIFSGSMGYFYGPHVGINFNCRSGDAVGLQLVWDDIDGTNCANIPATTGTEPGDWVSGTVTMDASPICEYYEQKPYRRRVFMLNRADGTEFTYDSDNDDNPEYIPFTFAGITQSGCKYPPVVGNDGVLYSATYQTPGWTAGISLCGWKVGTQYISRVAAGGKGSSAGDEPMCYSIGGKLAYQILCCDRWASGYDLTIPYGQPNRYWDHWGYSGRWSVFPDYQPMYYNEPTGDMNGGGRYGDSLYGTYEKHGIQNPWVPYNGKLYHQMGNCVIAAAPGGSANSPLPMATVVPVTDQVPSVTVAQLKQKLEEEIQKMITAGHLKPGLHKSNIGDFALMGNNYMDEAADMDHGVDYFSNPGETIYTLIRALPLLSASLQQQTSAYIKTEMLNYPIDSITHVGFTDGVWRQAAEPAQDMIGYWTSYGKQTTVQDVNNGYLGHTRSISNYPWTFPMMSFYAAWKYAQVWPSEAVRLYNNMKPKLTISRPAPLDTDSRLIQSLQMLNAYLAGYKGYLELEKLAEQPESTNVKTEYTRLLDLRADNFSFDTPIKAWGTIYGGADYGPGFAAARHFLYLVPEVAQELITRRPAIVQEVRNLMDKINSVTPYWFVSKYEACVYEGTFQNLYEVTVFNGNVMILNEPYEELLKYLDASAFLYGDLFYIQNLVHTIEATPITATKLNLEANPTVIEANGTSTCLVTAKVCDDVDRIVANSTAQITFTRTSGGGSLIGTNPINASAGIATITYQAGTTEETVTITATSSGLSQGSININLVVNDPPDAPTNLLCNNQQNPTGLADLTPDLSWTFSDPDSGDTQTAYRLLVADNQNALDSNNGNMWDTTKITGPEGIETTVTYEGMELSANTMYYWKVATWDSFDTQGAYSQTGTFTMGNTDPRAFHGIPFQIPCKIEIEDYDVGGEGVAYHDTTLGNSGGLYRNENVDISDDQAGGYLISANPQGEWLEYTVDVVQSGTYTIEVFAGATGLGGTFHIEFDGINKTDTLQVPDTGSGGCWNEQTIPKTGVSLTAGRQIMRLVIDSNHTVWDDYCGCMNYVNVILEGQITPEITVTSPNGNETWTAGTQSAVTWTSAGTIGNVNIDLSTDSGSSWSTLIGNTANDGAETISVPNSPSTTCRVRVVDIDGTPSDMSDNNFRITEPVQPQITVTSPNGGETWIVGNTKTVMWTSQGTVGNVNISLSTDGGTNWSTLASATANDGAETITVPNSPSTSCKIRVRDVSGSPDDISNSNFTIIPAGTSPSISVTPATLDFEEVDIGETSTLNFQITNTGGGILSGSITTDKKWIIVEPTSFVVDPAGEGNSATVDVTVDNSVLNQSEGQYTGIITITSNDPVKDTFTIDVTLRATCVLAKPNPYDPSKGNLTFFGDGIVPGETTIKIYTLSGELIKILSIAKSRAFEGQWNGTNENGKQVTSGIYIYIYESPREKGVGKLTVIRQ